MEKTSIFDFFYEKTAEEQLAEQAETILQSKRAQFGGIIPGDQFTAEEQSIIDAHLAQKLEGFLRSKAAQDTPEAPPPDAPTNFPPLQPPPLYTPGHGPLERAFQDVARKALVEVKPTVKVTPVEAMSLFLSRVCLRRYNDEYYLFNGAVFNHVQSNELNRIIFHYLRDVIATVGNATIIKQVADLVKANPDIDACFTADGPDVQYFTNGALDHGIFRSVDLSRDFFTTYCPFPYPTRPEDTACPIFDHFLATTFPGDPASIAAVWEMTGYLIVRDMAGKCLFVLQGKPNSGKSVLGTLISELLNQDAVFSLEPRRFSEKFALHGLVGCRLNVCMDLPNGRLNQEAVAALKQITGADSVTDEGKYANAQRVRLETKFLFGTNFPFVANGADDGFLERLIIIPFLVSVPPELRDPYLLDKLRAELPAIAAKALAAYQNVRRNNYSFALPRASERALYHTTSAVDPMAAFLAECCDLCDSKIFTPTAILHEEYKLFCQAHGYPWLEQSAQFSRQLRTCCSRQIKPSKQRYNGEPTNGYFGIRLRNDAPS